MVIASWKPIADLLVQQGIAANLGSYYTLDMAKFLELMKAEARWKDIPGNTAFTANKSVLITSTDVRTSNSAAMYLALLSYVANGNNIVQSLDAARPMLPVLSGLFLRQGLRPTSTREPFEDYLVQGMGHSPIVIIYEAQYVAQAARGDGEHPTRHGVDVPDADHLHETRARPLQREGREAGGGVGDRP